MCCAQVWPGQAVFPDYLFNPNTYKWLKEQLAAWYQAVPFDGLWLDMNEPASFCEGQFCAPDPTNETSMHCECHGGGVQALCKNPSSSRLCKALVLSQRQCKCSDSQQ